MIASSVRSMRGSFGDMKNTSGIISSDASRESDAIVLHEGLPLCAPALRLISS